MNTDYSELISIIRKTSDRSQIPDIIRYLKDPVICEVGVQDGNHFKNILTDNVKKAYAIDCWFASDKLSENDSDLTQNQLDEQYSRVCERFKSDSRVEIIRDFSKNASDRLENESLDFVYIDADHTYEAVKSDLECWYPKLKKGGILSGHDYIEVTHFVKNIPIPFDVVKAVAEFMKQNNIDKENIHITNENYASFFIVKM